MGILVLAAIFIAKAVSVLHPKIYSKKIKKIIEIKNIDQVSI
jgi:hypothetical protein